MVPQIRQSCTVLHIKVQFGASAIVAIVQKRKLTLWFTKRIDNGGGEGAFKRFVIAQTALRVAIFADTHNSTTE